MNSELEAEIFSLKTQIDVSTYWRDWDFVDDLQKDVDDMEKVLEECIKNNTEAEYYECNQCDGNGKITQYDEKFKCSSCNGNGGRWA